ncbi:hypothetical protein [Alterisphingorhabdus coralli]|uniref:Uncharacterized protein n=1 Tax=Alterisphingorhabdus coralli TaxID=3071408 RepID=A0AA97F703_9SPHN|nr:hypothetical protein [Parasphingorhabdus sp. SCSIO 66989]WOE75569.1 hypothetical protein RB602_02320 [Parasphingorhabdus sp. SCSIO 66989]
MIHNDHCRMYSQQLQRVSFFGNAGLAARPDTMATGDEVRLLSGDLVFAPDPEKDGTHVHIPFIKAIFYAPAPIWVCTRRVPGLFLGHHIIPFQKQAGPWATS